MNKMNKSKDNETNKSEITVKVAVDHENHSIQIPYISYYTEVRERI